MRSKFIIAALAALLCIPAIAAEKQDTLSTQKKEIIKKGLNLGPLPVIAYDADKGFQFGAILQLFNYGDGSHYPSYDNKTYLEASFFTKGSMLFQLMHDNKTLIPGVRWSSAAALAFDKGMDFTGFNGYQSFYDYEKIAAGKSSTMYTMPDGTQTTGLFSPFYRYDRTSLLVKSDFIGNITEHFKWEAGYHFAWFKQQDIDYDNINKGKTAEQDFPTSIQTLWKNYLDWGLISPEEAYGGIVSSIRAGLVYDSRDKEGAPTRGIWAEGHVMLAPKWLGSTVPFYRYALTFRHYVPIVKNDILTFAYRLNYEGTFGDNAPYYVLPYITVMGENNDKDGFGGYRNVRGIIRNRVVGLDEATYTAEFRWRFVKFPLWKQNIALGLSAFSDGSMVTRGRNLTPTRTLTEKEQAIYDYYIRKDMASDLPHITFGAGFRFIMNENFIVAVEYGMPISHLMPNSPIYNQDGNGAFYVNIGYLF